MASRAGCVNVARYHVMDRGCRHGEPEPGGHAGEGEPGCAGRGHRDVLSKHPSRW